MKRNPPLKKLFLTGLNTLLPVILSILVIIVILNFFIFYVGFPIGKNILFVLENISSWNLTYLENNLLISTAVGIVALLLIITIVGYLAILSGRRITELIEDGAIGKLPFIRIFYPYAKQITSFLSGQDKNNFRNVVAVEYPNKGIYSLGFVTSNKFESLTNSVKLDCVTVFIPASPTPFTGSTVFVTKEKVIPLPISVDEALRIIISGGILTQKKCEISLATPGTKRGNKPLPVIASIPAMASGQGSGL
jgi:uncharacterized membrane protein